MRMFQTAAICALIVSAALCTGCGEKKSTTQFVRPVRTFTVGEAQSRPQRVYTGTLAAHTYVNAAFEVPGRILRRYPSVGDRVHAGDKLAELDPVIYRDQLKAAKADVSNARAVLQQATQAYVRAKKLAASRAVSEQQLEAAERACLGARAQLEAALSNEHRVGEQLSYTTIRAKGDGRIVSRFFEAGEVAAAGQPVYRIAMNDGVDAVFSVPEEQTKSLSAGTRVRVCTLGTQSVCSDAEVEEIEPQANALTRTFQVKAHVADAGAFSLGMTLECTLQASEERFWRIPSAALTHTPKGEDAVWVLDEKTSEARQHPVQVSLYTRNDVLISAGLASGVKVITAGVHVLQQGQKVRESAHAAP